MLKFLKELKNKHIQ